MDQIIRTGLIGFGISGQVFHAPFLVTVPGYQLRSIVQRHGDLAASLYPGARLLRSSDELLEDPEIDLVVITTPNSDHYPLAIQAMEAKKHVVVEKPFTITSAQALELGRLADHQGVILSVYHNRRYTGDFRTICQILDEHTLGEIAEFEAHYDRYRLQLRPGAWREQDNPGSGILYDLGSHLIDQALFLFGLPLSITASLRIQRPGARTNDYFDLRLDYPMNAVRLKSGMLVRELGPRYMVHGTLGSFLKYGEDPQEALLRAGSRPLGPDWGMESQDNWGILHTQEGENVIRKAIPTLRGNFGDYYRDLYGTLTAGKPLRVSAQDGYRTIRLIELAMESNRLARTVPWTESSDGHQTASS